MKAGAKPGAKPGAKTTGPGQAQVAKVCHVHRTLSVLTYTSQAQVVPKKAIEEDDVEDLIPAQLSFRAPAQVTYQQAHHHVSSPISVI